MTMYTPQVPKPQTSAGGDRATGPGDTGVKNREPVPFMYNKQLDHVEEAFCTICGAPLKVYELKEHRVACDAIQASDGKDKEFPQVADVDDDDDEGQPVGTPG